MKTRYRFVGPGLAAALFTCASASAQIFTLFDRNADASINTLSQQGQFSWHINGVNHMYQQWFWFRAGNDAFERSIDTLAQVGAQALDSNPLVDPRPDTLDALYQDPRFNIEINMRLRGADGGAVSSDIAEQVTITNTTQQPLPYHFFEYVDLDLNGTPQDSLVRINNGNTAQQFEGPFVASEAVVTTMPSHLETNFYPNTLNSLNDGLPTTLNDNAGPLGPGDLTWAFQWDLLIGPGQSVNISKDKIITPAPGSIALVATAGAFGLRRRRR
jgi:hypothetical protein